MTVNTLVMSFKDRTISITPSQRTEVYSSGNGETESQTNLNHLLQNVPEHHAKASTKSARSFKSI